MADDRDFDWQDHFLPLDETARRFDGITPSWEQEQVRLQEQDDRRARVILWLLAGACVVMVALGGALLADLPVPIHPDCKGDPKC